MNLQPPPEDATPWEKDLYEFLKYPVYPGPVKVNGAFTINNISFPATAVPSADANTLDDYEEGTFTPAVTSVAVTYNYTYQVGFYTKIGNVVFFSIYIVASGAATGTLANEIAITGLPFTAQNTTVMNHSVHFGQIFQVNYPATAVELTGYIEPNTTQIVPVFSVDDGDQLIAIGTDFDSATNQFMIGGHYQI